MVKAKARQSKKSGKQRCMRPGPMTNNGYLNFLREFKQQPENCGLSPQETFKRAGRMWCRLKPEQKKCYKNKGPKAKAMLKKSRGRSTSRRKSAKRGCGRSKPKKPVARRTKTRGCVRRGSSKKKVKKERCKRMQAGPITNNGYLNFMRYYRRTVCNLKPTEVIKRGARVWCRLSPEKKEKYNRMACEVSKSERRKCTRLCQMVRRKKLEAAKRKRAKGGKGKGRKC